MLTLANSAENPSETPLSTWKSELFEQRRMRLRDIHTGYTPPPRGALPTPTITYAQVLWFLPRLTLTRYPASWVTTTSLTVCFTNPVYTRRLDPSVLVFRLSLYRHPSTCILFTSHFTSYNKLLEHQERKTMTVLQTRSDRSHVTEEELETTEGYPEGEE